MIGWRSGYITAVTASIGLHVLVVAAFLIDWPSGSKDIVVQPQFIQAELIQLKGIGEYTASAVASFSSNEKVAVVDGNVYRVLSRYFGIHDAIDQTIGKKKFKNVAELLLPIEHTDQYNQAIMEFGAVQCKPQNPFCENCPFQASCVAFEKKIIKI